ncbi:MAG: transcriptional coactivator p15/PC4 family protein [Spirochaetia bacterium]|nr:transcriptional coactivator p15/PC4 family protein [Spirochaetia bacterium]
MIVINDDIRVMKQEFKGKSYVSVRKWYQDNGEWKPGKQGINLKMEEWDEFLNKLEAIKEDLKA